MWYAQVSRNLSLLPKAMEYYETELILAKKECKIFGSLIQATSTLPGIVEHRYGQLQEIDAILELLNIELTKVKSKHLKDYHTSHNKAYTQSAIDKMIMGEDDVIDHLRLINEFALLRNKWLGITKGLDQKAYAINNLTKLKCAGLDDATID